MKLFTVNTYYLPLKEKPAVNNHCLTLINLGKTPLKIIYSLIKIFTIKKYNESEYL